MSSTLQDTTQFQAGPHRTRNSAMPEPSSRRGSPFAVADDLVAYPAVSAFAPPMNFRVDLDMFRGPMDLLLYLVRKHELDITDIPVAVITDQYVSYLEVLEELDVDAVGDFVEVASLLVEIKSRMVLPQVDDEDATALEDDPRDELVQRLLEYKKYKDAASMLDEAGHAWQQRFARVVDDLPPQEVDRATQPIQDVELWDLVSAMGRIMRESQRSQTSNIVYDDTPIQVHMQRIHDRLIREQRVSFTGMFCPGMNKSTLIGVFLAVLELARNYGVDVEQVDLHCDIWLTPSDRFHPTLDLSEVFAGQVESEVEVPAKPR